MFYYEMRGFLEMSVLVSMLVGSKLSTKSLVEKSISSILLNIGTEDFLLLIGVSSNIGQDIVKYIEDVRLKNTNVIIITDYCSSFAKFHNYVFLEYGSGYKWFIISHDDICVETKDIVGKVEQCTQSFLDKVGWISFTDTGYINGYWSPSTTPGYHIDVLYEKGWDRRKLLQFHLLEENYWKKGNGISYFSNLKYDFPIGVVKCHAPFSHFIMIETKKLRKIGLCEDWSEISLLIDEDWGLSVLKEGLFNIWIPHIRYMHHKDNEGGTRAWPIILEKRKHVHKLFIRKWGFSHNPLGDDLKKIKRMYGNTNIVWSFDRRSFDWDYIR